MSTDRSGAAVVEFYKVGSAVPHRPFVESAMTSHGGLPAHSRSLLVGFTGEQFEIKDIGELG
ncbi:hypothetical protein RGR602_PB00515 (plasmid) [Rhizobium gallicum bv. gallicum R602sp]|uniref:Uncharacterized protein n=1 Tax=Rhizobium gallicum bv. gallicum R602sp TaxID=1041138 RepID=A0A0B4X7S7_9HYPH|nr:hypothetical protein RGR602_PB00515 [Rhizobium gallicum bv. gallicum R602sp]